MFYELCFNISTRDWSFNINFCGIWPMHAIIVCSHQWEYRFVMINSYRISIECKGNLLLFVKVTKIHILYNLGVFIIHYFCNCISEYSVIFTLSYSQITQVFLTHIYYSLSLLEWSLSVNNQISSEEKSKQKYALTLTFYKAAIVTSWLRQQSTTPVQDWNTYDKFIT